MDLESKTSKDNFITYCRKCDEPFQGKLSRCPECNNKAYLKVMLVANNSIIVNNRTRTVLENLCRTQFPQDVLAIVPPRLDLGKEDEKDKK